MQHYGLKWDTKFNLHKYIHFKFTFSST